MVALRSFLATAAVLAQGALAVPAQLATRGDGLHLLNCWPIGGAGVPQTWISIVVVSKPAPP